MLEFKVGEGKDRARGEKDRPWPLYKEGEYQASSAWSFGTCLKSRSHTSRHDWVTHTRIDENPVIRGTRSLLQKTCQENRLTTRAVAGWEKRFVTTGPRLDVTLLKVVRRSNLWNIVLSTVVCGICLAEPDTILVFKIFYGVFGGGTRLAMPKTICAPDSSS